MTISPELAHAALISAIRQSPLALLKKAISTFQPGVNYVHGAYIDAALFELDQIRLGETRRLIINMPPRHLKSQLVSVAWVAWMLGQDPSLKFLCLSYSNVLAEEFHRDCRRIMETPWYAEAFPRTRLRRSTDTKLETTRGGVRIASSVGGTLTGRGADIIIIDDPLKAEDGMSEALRSSVNEWASRTVFSRLDDKEKGAVVIVMQRLHEDDLTGKLLGKGGWRHLSLPLLFEEPLEVQTGPHTVHRWEVGEILHPERFTRRTVEEIRSDSGSMVFAAQYQQAPAPAGGLAIKRDWLGFAPPPPPEGGRIFQSWDTASSLDEKADWSVCITFFAKGPDIYILDVLRLRLEFPELLRKVAEHARRWPVREILIENASSGIQLYQALRRNPPPGLPSLIAIKPEISKRARMELNTSCIEGGHLILPQEATWLASFLSELCAFPYGRHDDQVDALSQGLEWYNSDPVRRLGPIMPVLTEREGGSYWIGDDYSGGSQGVFVPQLP